MRWLATILLAAVAAAQQPVTVATHYFYWYRWPDEHFASRDDPSRSGHTHHFPHPEAVDYTSPAWHRQNFETMARCGIDAALPVYWGAPGAYDKPHLRFSRAGLPAMVQALDDLAAAGTPAVSLGLFYDTTTLANDTRGARPAGGRADLTTAAGQALFCDTVVEYFEAIPKRHWARHRGGVLVVLYTSAWAEAWDRNLGQALRQAFAARFEGERLCLVADASWGDIGQDLTTGWGAALHGPRLYPGVAQIGPGYDDSHVATRRTPIRRREDGAFYVRSWQQALAHRPELVLLETWNEMHEGSEICPTVELGDRYVELTAQWVGKLRAGAPPGEPVTLLFPEPLQRPDRSWGKAAEGAAELRCDYTGTAPVRFGLREIAWEDGPLRLSAGALQPLPVAGGGRGYLYFQVSDCFAFDEPGDYVLEVTVRGPGRLAVEYDSFDEKAPGGGAYTRADPIQRAPEWGAVRWTFRLRDARLGNRQNGHADFRVVLPQPAPALLHLELRPLRRR